MVKRQNGVEGGRKSRWRNGGDEILQEGAVKGEGDAIDGDGDEQEVAEEEVDDEEMEEGKVISRCV